MLRVRATTLARHSCSVPRFLPSICGLLTLRSLRFSVSLAKILGSAADSAAARTAFASVALLNFT